jgi:ABC-type antimicrobial peptide transport system permease subunit
MIKRTMNTIRDSFIIIAILAIALFISSMGMHRYALAIMAFVLSIFACFMICVYSGDSDD